ncbi:hypothetical protein EI94DRAFT_931025 [Lactarius quietus]|nr:hypothetical protein EI94DRAFT_931025 [Lactarius quietus]
MQPTSSSPSPSPSNRGSRRHPHPEHPSSVFPQNPHQLAFPAPFPQSDYRSTDQYNFPTPAFQRQRAVSSYARDTGIVNFPEPQLYRSESSEATFRPLTPNPDQRTNNLRTTSRLSPALPPALPPRNSVASPKSDEKQVTFRSFDPLPTVAYPAFNSACGSRNPSRSE